MSVQSTYNKYKGALGGGLDLHAWVVLPNGEIYDPEFPYYSFCKLVHGIEAKAENVYAPIKDKQERQKIWACVWVLFVKPRKALLQQYLTTPKENCCFVNAYAFHKANPGSVMNFGRMGWRKTDGSVWWEFG